MHFYGSAIYNAQTEYESTSWASDTLYSLSMYQLRQVGCNGLVDNEAISNFRWYKTQTDKVLPAVCLMFHLKQLSVTEGDIANPNSGKRLVVPWPKDA